MLRRRGDGERGAALIVAMMVITMMVTLGFAALAVVDAQTREAGTERNRDSAFNLAEGVLNAQSALLSRSWPESSALAFSTACTQASTGVARCPSPSLLSSSFSGGDFGSATWRSDVRDDSGSYTTTWEDGTVAGAGAWDQNGNGQVWVRAQATIRGKTQAVLGKVQVNRAPAVPRPYAVLTGRFSTDLGVALNQVVASPLLTNLIGNHKLISGGKIGLRCSVLSGCVTSVFALLSTLQLDTLFANEVVQYHSTTAASDDVIAQLRQRALDAGTYYASVTAGAACPAPPVGSTTAVIFVEQVGTGDGTCTVTLTTTSTPRVRALVIGSGRVQFSGNGTYEGVVWALNRQRLTLGDGAREVVRIQDNARVRGTVLADGAGGSVGIYPPPLNVYSLIDTLPVCQGLLAILCAPLKVTLRALGVDALLTQLISLVGLTSVVNGLAGQLSTYAPAVTYDETIASALVTNISSGTVANSFREIVPAA